MVSFRHPAPPNGCAYKTLLINNTTAEPRTPLLCCRLQCSDEHSHRQPARSDKKRRPPDSEPVTNGTAASSAAPALRSHPSQRQQLAARSFNQRRPHAAASRLAAPRGRRVRRDGHVTVTAGRVTAVCRARSLSRPEGWQQVGQRVRRSRFRGSSAALAGGAAGVEGRTGD